MCVLTLLFNSLRSFWCGIGLVVPLRYWSRAARMAMNPLVLVLTVPCPLFAPSCSLMITLFLFFLFTFIDSSLPPFLLLFISFISALSALSVLFLSLSPLPTTQLLFCVPFLSCLSPHSSSAGEQPCPSGSLSAATLRLKTPLPLRGASGVPCAKRTTPRCSDHAKRLRCGNHSSGRLCACKSATTSCCSTKQRCCGKT